MTLHTNIPVFIIHAYIHACISTYVEFAHLHEKQKANMHTISTHKYLSTTRHQSPQQLHLRPCYARFYFLGPEKCVCMCVYIHINTYTNTYIHMYVYTQGHVRLCYAHFYFLGPEMCVCVYGICIYIYMYIHHTYTIHAYKHTHTNTQTHTRAHVCIYTEK